MSTCRIRGASLPSQIIPTLFGEGQNPVVAAGCTFQLKSEHWSKEGSRPVEQS